MQIIHDRRALHQIPELELDLPQTMEYVLSALRPLKCRVLTPVGCAVCAYFDFGREHTVAFRADMDALPIQETTDAPYASTHPGRMHACGHDGHTAILLELARRLDQKNALPNNVLLIFQPGEESPGGANLICRTGILQAHRVKAIFGLHLWPGLEKGCLFSRENELMSHASEINVDIFGRSAHIAKYAEGVDAMAAGMEFLRIVRDKEAAYPSHIHRLLKFGRMESGSVRNAVSDHTRLEGSLRAFQDEIYDDLCDAVHFAADEVSRKFGCRVEISLSPGYPAVMNPPELYQRVRAIVPVQPLDAPTMTAEDFAFYQRQVPGFFCFLGIGDTPPLHAANFDFDESILTKGAGYFEALAEGFV